VSASAVVIPIRSFEAGKSRLGARLDPGRVFGNAFDAQLGT